MAPLSDSIERFIKELLAESDAIELHRNELAAYFGCAPSQINYVLTTRFTLDRGYMITSRRGGGGSIQVLRLDFDEDNYIHDLINHRLEAEISQKEAFAILDRLEGDGFIDEREGALMRSAMVNLPMVPRNVAPYVRSAILKNMLLTLVRSDENAV